MSLPENNKGQRSRTDKQFVPASALSTNNDDKREKRSFKIIQNESQNHFIVPPSEIQEPWTDKKQPRIKNLIQSEERGNLTDTKQSILKMEGRGHTM
jgi:hypothetical protein